MGQNRTFKQLERILTIQRLLTEREFMTNHELSEYFQVSSRTVIRDINLLDDVGYQIVSDPKLGYSLVQSPVPSQRFLSAEEWLALTIYPRLLQGHVTDDAAYDIYQSGLEKMKMYTKGTAQDQVESLSQGLGERIRFQEAGKDRHEGSLMPLIIRGMTGNKILDVRYYGITRDQISERLIHPYYIVPRLGHLYLVAFCENKQEMRTFRLDRFKHVHLTDETFTMNPHFSIESYLEKSWGIFNGDEEETHFVVRFNSQTARYIQELTFYVDTEVTTCEDGSVLLRATVKSKLEFLRWVRQFGLKAELLEPVDVRDELAEEYRQQYEQLKKSQQFSIQ
ncbi:transcriptional regulator [Bacillaceae bacterium SIJ1]|uniref:helix-turn-helix transcriptional regulator n=1 Tax=Litoribacterium kuwaitense TaxID=1398745 RepID=UPI0013ED6865|nr:transcriptional regulator [Litoribacterium kuwaitense]NGP44618.1 transcriptional regulator [Litoribacterium kuwaitense]